MASLDKFRHRKAKRRPNDSPFRRLVLEARGASCRVCGEHRVQAAHIWGKGQTGPSVVENGIPLCLDHHTAYDHYSMKLRPEWLDADQIAWLGQQDYVTWGDDGAPFGRGMHRFENRLPAPGGDKREERQ